MLMEKPTIDYGTVHGTNEHGLFELRMQRDRLLAESDWVVTMHKELGTNIPSAWKTYRQALRDMTKTYSTVPLTSKGHMDDEKITWPTKPSE